MANKLFLLDGMALVYRAHFALIRSPIYTSKGFNSSALYGFTNTLVDLLSKQSPSHIAVVFDTKAATERHKIFPEYKAQRDAMPEDLSIALPEVKRIIKAFNIPVIERDGFEADDVIGTLAKKAIQDDPKCEVFMVTPDKDFAQLVEKGIFLFKPAKGGNEPEILDVDKIKEQWDIETPNQVIDILGLWGDASDNIPGVPGIGEKTAKKLISKYSSIENILENVNDLKGKQKENLENFSDQALLSKKLVTIITDAPVDLDWKDLKLSEINKDELSKICIEFEFNAIGKRLLGDEFVAGRGFEIESQDNDQSNGVLKTISDVDHNYIFVKAQDSEKREKQIAKLKKTTSLCFDTETTGKDPIHDELLGISFANSAGKAIYFQCPSEIDLRKVFIDDFRELFQDESIEKIGHNLKFDLTVLHWCGLKVGGALFDTMLAHTLVFPDQKHSMDFVAESMLGYSPISFNSLIDDQENEDQLSLIGTTISEVDTNKLAEYAAEDADITFQISEKLRPLLKEKGQEKVFYDIESPLIAILVAIESEGISLNCQILDQIRESLSESINSLGKEITELAGKEFNLNSPKQLGEVLFDDLKLVEKPKKTKTGQYKTDEGVLNALAPKHRVVEAILEYRESAKLKSTYVDALPNALSKKTGRIHSSFGQLMTATGRLASNNPNLQNIPIRTSQGREIRKAFVPRSEDFKILAADYSQIELRVMASISGDESMRSAFNEGLDIHSATAAKVYDVDIDEVSSDMRRGAKTVNFGIIYGISAFGLSQRLDISRSEAADLIDSYFEEYPRVKEYMDDTILFAKENGFVETVSGRRRYLRDINSSNAMIRSAAERTAINTPIQGTAADMIKLAMVGVHQALSEGGFKTKMILQVHDELLFDMAIEEEDKIKEIVVEEMQNALPMEIPAVVDVGVGENWLEAH
ncbi:MAG: DNA polymerase I [Verrucomicrobiota bacterium]|nr:DNA polymerase I [Verrucomicrobiota bacterium]